MIFYTCNQAVWVEAAAAVERVFSDVSVL